MREFGGRDFIRPRICCFCCCVMLAVESAVRRASFVNGIGFMCGCGFS